MSAIFKIVFKKVAAPFLLVTMILSFHKTSYSQDRDYKLIFSSNLLQNMKIEDAIATTKILAKKIQQKMELKEEIEIVVAGDLNDIINEIKKPYDFILATGVETELLKRKHNIEPVLVNETDGTYGFEYLLVVNKNKNFNSLSLLKNLKIAILSKSEYHTAPIWLDKLLRDEKLPAKEKYFSEIKYDYKANNVLLPVFFNKIEAAVISKSAYDLLCELNPQIKKQIQILMQSENLIFGVISFDGRSKDAKRKEFMLDVLKTLHEENYGKQLLDLFMVEKIIPYKEEYWQKFMKLYN